MREDKQNQVKFHFNKQHVMKAKNRNWPQTSGTASRKKIIKGPTQKMEK